MLDSTVTLESECNEGGGCKIVSNCKFKGRRKYSVREVRCFAANMQHDRHTTITSLVSSFYGIDPRAIQTWINRNRNNAYVSVTIQLYCTSEFKRGTSFKTFRPILKCERCGISNYGDIMPAFMGKEHPEIYKYNNLRL